MAKRKKKPYNLKSKITSALRRIWFYSPMRREAVARSIANGNICEICLESKDKLTVDHVQPVVPLTQDYDWEDYIQRLFVSSEYLRTICKECHAVHTQVQAKQRNTNKKKLKLDKIK